MGIRVQWRKIKRKKKEKKKKRMDDKNKERKNNIKKEMTIQKFYHNIFIINFK